MNICQTVLLKLNEGYGLWSTNETITCVVLKSIHRRHLTAAAAITCVLRINEVDLTVNKMG